MKEKVRLANLIAAAGAQQERSSRTLRDACLVAEGLEREQLMGLKSALRRNQHAELVAQAIVRQVRSILPTDPSPTFTKGAQSTDRALWVLACMPAERAAVSVEFALDAIANQWRDRHSEGLARRGASGEPRPELVQREVALDALALADAHSRTVADRVLSRLPPEEWEFVVTDAGVEGQVEGLEVYLTMVAPADGPAVVLCSPTYGAATWSLCSSAAQYVAASGLAVHATQNRTALAA